MLRVKSKVGPAVGASFTTQSVAWLLGSFIKATKVLPELRLFIEDLPVTLTVDLDWDMFYPFTSNIEFCYCYSFWESFILHRCTHDSFSLGKVDFKTLKPLELKFEPLTNVDLISKII